VASTCAHAVQLLAVAPAARGRGVGSRLLDAALASIAATGAPRARVLGLAGNYLAPGVDARAVDTLAWLARRGFAPRGEPVTNLLLDVRDNPRVSAATADAAAARVRAAGYVVRRAHRDEPALLAAIAAEFGGAWPFEVARALTAAPGAPGVHVALAPDGSYAGFAAHDGNNAGLGWFGPAGTWPAHRGRGLGEALLLACLRRRGRPPPALRGGVDRPARLLRSSRRHRRRAPVRHVNQGPTVTRAMLLCAGLGSRLGAIGAAVPKPMLPVLDRPILEYGIAGLRGHGITDLVINLHHRGDVIEQTLGDGRRLGVRIRYTHEEVLLGTGGGLRHALPLLDEDGADAPFVSLNGKLIFDVDLTAVLATHREALAADPRLLGVMVVRPVPDAVAWGAVDVRPSGPGGALRVHDVLGDGQHMFCGVHVTRPSVVRRLPGGEACMIRQGYLPWLKAGEPVGAYVHERGYFAEHSTAERYLASNLDLLAGATPLRHPPGALGRVDPTARIAPSATIIGPVHIGPGAIIEAGATVGPGAVIGAGAVVAAGALVERAVVWPGVTTSGTVRDQIVSGAA
jgi:mannose-1-phosphate guanylyltransferase